MTASSHSRISWIQVKEYAPAIVAAALMFGGLQRILHVLGYPLTNAVMEGINGIIRRGLRDTLPLANSEAGFPWQFYAHTLGEGVIVTVTGLLIGVWAHVRNQHPPTQ